MDSDDDSISCASVEGVEEVAKASDITSTSLNLLTEKSKKLYDIAYNQFMGWRRDRQIDSFSEQVLLTYFAELSNNYKSSTLWTYYSMLRSTLNIHHNVNIEHYHKIRALLKRKAENYQPKKTKTLSPEQINKFIVEAPDVKYLATKVALIMGITGACHAQELYALQVQDLLDLNTEFLVTLPKSKTKVTRQFKITDNFYTICKKYIDLRPPDLPSLPFFLNYQNGKCTVQRIGINKFGGMAKEVAAFLKLPNPELYTGHTFRKSSAIALVDGGDVTEGGWKSTIVAEGYVDESLIMVSSCSAYNCTNRYKRGSGVSFHKFPIDPQLREKWVEATRRKNFIPSGNSVLCSEHFKTDDYINSFGNVRLKDGVIPSLFDFKSKKAKKRRRRKSTDEDTEDESYQVKLEEVYVPTLSRSDSSDREPSPEPVVPQPKTVKRDTCTQTCRLLYTMQSDSLANVPHSSTKQDTSNKKCTLVLTIGGNNVESIPQPTTEPGTFTQNYMVSNVEVIPTGEKRRRSVQVYLGDFKMEDMNYPEDARRMFEIAHRAVAKKNKELQYLRTKTKRLQKRIETIQELFELLKRRNRVLETVFSALQSSWPDGCCSAFGCSTSTGTDSSSSRKKRHNNFTLHKFPEDPDIKDKWVKAIGRKNWQPSEHSVICSRHFSRECFLDKNKLIKGAVPTIFEFSAAMKPPTYSDKEKNALKTRLAGSSLSTEQEIDDLEDLLASSEENDDQEETVSVKEEEIFIKEEALVDENDSNTNDENFSSSHLGGYSQAPEINIGKLKNFLHEKMTNAQLPEIKKELEENDSTITEIEEDFNRIDIQIKQETQEIEEQDVSFEESLLHFEDFRDTDEFLDDQHSDTETQCASPDMRESAEEESINLLPERSRTRYEKTYNMYMDWCSKKGVHNTSESVLEAYFTELARNKKPSTLWAIYSMLRATLHIKDNVNISKFGKLLAYLKKQNVGYKPKQSNILTKENIEDFLKNAPVDFLPQKVALIIGISGACRSDELVRMKITDVDVAENKITVVIPDTKTDHPKAFVIIDPNWVKIVKQYLSLRENVEHERLFLQLRYGKLTKQPVGHNSISQFPRKIASYLKLKNSESFTGHCFRRTAAALRANKGREVHHLKSL